MQSCIWIVHHPDRSRVWFTCTPHRNTLMASTPGLVAYPATIRSYCGFCQDQPGK